MQSDGPVVGGAVGLPSKDVCIHLERSDSGGAAQTPLLTHQTGVEDLLMSSNLGGFLINAMNPELLPREETMGEKCTVAAHERRRKESRI